MTVFAPKGASGPLPVMVWIYGGAYSQGGTGAKEHGSKDVQYDLAGFAAKTNCVVFSAPFSGDKERSGSWLCIFCSPQQAGRTKICISTRWNLDRGSENSEGPEV
ncbi:MAG: carboxylesterase family protein [Blautia sp.]|nr:carboxylesterase family protein [Blautia sp.]